MKIRALFICFLIIGFHVFGGCEKDTEEPEKDIVDIPDVLFLYALIDREVDTDGDELISHDEAEAVITLDIGNYEPVLGYSPESHDWCGQIRNLDGIEAFTNLEELTCFFNKLTALDVSGNKKLTWLRCDGNYLTSLDVSQNTALQYLECGNYYWVDRNEIRNLDVTHNDSLLTLKCDGNKISSLDLSNNGSLETLICHSNWFSSLDVSENTVLVYLDYSNNQLTSLDISNNTSIGSGSVYRSAV